MIVFFQNETEIDIFSKKSNCSDLCQIHEAPRFHSKIDGTISLFSHENFTESSFDFLVPLCFSMVPIHGRLQMPKILSIIIYWFAFKLIFLHKYEPDLFYRGFRRNLCNWEALCFRRLTDFDPSVEFSKVRNSQKSDNNFYMNLRSVSQFLRSIGWISSKLLIHRNFSVKGSSIWISSNYAQPIKFSWQAKSAEKRNCFCYFVYSQIHIPLRLFSNLALLAQVQ